MPIVAEKDGSAELRLLQTLSTMAHLTSATNTNPAPSSLAYIMRLETPKR